MSARANLVAPARAATVLALAPAQAPPARLLETSSLVRPAGAVAEWRRPLLPAPPVRPTDARLASEAEVRRIIAVLAPVLGLDPARIELRMGPDAAMRVEAAGAAALAECGAILLHPARVAPETPAGRHIVAHEVAHLAQRRLPAQRRRREVAAEIEAEAIATAFDQGLVPARPRIGLAGTAAFKANYAVEEVASRPGELARIRDLLHPFLWISNDDVTEILSLLGGLELATALALVGSLTPDERHDLINNIDDAHYKPFRREVLLVYQATEPGEISTRFDEGLLTGIAMVGLTPVEAMAVQHVYDALSPKARDALLASKVGGAVCEVAAAIAQGDVAARYGEELAKSVDNAAKERTDLADRRARAKDRLDAKGKPEAEAKAAGALQQAIATMRNELDHFIVRDANALRALDAAAPYAEDSAALQAIADGLTVLDEAKQEPGKPPQAYKEPRSFLDTLLDEVPVEALYDRASHRLRTLLRLMEARPAWKNQALARKLATGTFSGRDDAYLAFNLVKALPERERIAFVTKSPVWGDIQGMLAPSQRASSSLNLYGGGEDQSDRNAILAQLTDDRVWADPPRLSGLIGMAIAADEYAWVFAESQRRVSAAPGLLENEPLRSVVEKYRLYNPRPDAKRRDGRQGPRAVFDQEAYAPAAYGPRTGPRDKNTGLGYLIFGGLATAAEAVFKTSHPGPGIVEVSGINLADAQDLTDHEFFGVTLERQANLGMAGQEALKKGRGVNMLDRFRWDMANREMLIDLSEIALSSMHLMVGARKIQASGGRLGNVSVMLRYPSEALDEPVAIRVYIGELALDDVLLIGTGGMLAAEHVTARSVLLTLRTASTDPAPKRPEDTMLPGFFERLGDTLAMIGGLVGHERKRAVATTKLDLPGQRQPMALEVEFDALEAEGLATSSGQSARKLSVKDVALRGGGDRASYIEALRLSQLRLETRIGRESRALGNRRPLGQGVQGGDAGVIAQLEKQRAMVARELADFAEWDRLRALQAQHEANPAGSPAPGGAEAARLAALNRKFAQALGAVADIGTISAEGVQGLPVSGFKAENLHGQGASLGAVLGQGFLPQLLEGQPTLQPGARGDAGFALAIGHLETSALHIAGGIPTPGEAARDLASFLRGYHAGVPGAHDRLLELQHRRDLAGEYAGLLARGITRLDAKARDRLAALRRELEVLAEKYAIDVRGVTAEGTSLEAREDGRLSAHFDSLTAEGVADRGRGLGARRIVATDLAVSPNVRNGLFGLSDWRSNLRSGTISAGTFDIEGARHEASGTEIAQISLTGTAASADRQGPIAFKASGVQLALVSVETTRKLLEAEGVLLSRVPQGQNHFADLARMRAIDKALAALEAIEQREQAAAAALDAARAKQQKPAAGAAQRALDQARRDKLDWQVALKLDGLDIQNLDIVAYGIGDFLADDFDIEKALATGITVMAGESGQLASGGSAIGVKLPGIGLNFAEFGAVAGSFVVRGNAIEAKGFRLESLGIDGLDYQGAGNRVWSGGMSRLYGITLDGRIGLRQTRERDGTISRALGSLEVDSFGIERVEASRLGFSSTALGLSVDMIDGAAEGVFVRNLVVDLPAEEGGETAMHGPAAKPGKKAPQPEFGVGQLERLRLNAVIGRGLTVGGVLTGSDVKVTLLEAGQRIHVGDLSVAEGSISEAGKGSGRFTVTRLSGDILHRSFAGGDMFALSGIKLGSFALEKGFTWLTDTASVKVGEGAVVSDLKLSATVRRRKSGKEYAIEQIQVPELDVVKITAGKVDATLFATVADPKKNQKAAPEKNVSLEAATIDNLHVDGFDLVKGLGTLKVGAQDINQLGFRIAKKGEEAFKQGSLSIKGTGLTGTLSGEPLGKGVPSLMGPLRAGRLSIDLGRIETLSASYEDNEVSLKGISTRDIRGNVEIGPDYVELRDFNAGPIALGTVSYSDRAGNTVKLTGASTTGPMHLLRLRAGFKPDAKGEMALNSVVLHELFFETLDADGFSYTGVTTEEKDKVQTVSTTTLSATKAHIEPLHLVDLGMDLTTRVTSVEGGANRVTMSNFAAGMEKRVGGALKESTQFRSDITASDLHAKLSFETVKRANEKDFTRRTGVFSLGRLGLTDPSVTVLDEIGGSDASRLAVGSMLGRHGSIDFTGLKVTMAPNGTYLLELDDIIAKSLRIQQGKGGNTIDAALPFAQIKKAAVGLKTRELEDGITVLGASTGQITTQGLQVEIQRLRTGTGPGPFPAAERFVVEPLGDANGKLTLTGTTDFAGLAWHIKALVMPIEKGRIDLERAEVVPDDTGTAEDKKEREEKDESQRHLEVRKGALAFVTYPIGDLVGIGIEMPTTKGRQGLLEKPGKYGTVVLRDLVEDYLNEASVPNQPPADLSKLKYLGLLDSEFQMGAGRIGTDTYSLRLAAGVPGANLLKILRTQLGGLGAELGINAAKLDGAGIDFKATQHEGEADAGTSAGSTGAIDFTQVGVRITGLGGSGASAAFTINLTTDRGVIDGVSFGQVSILTPEAIAKQPGPALKEKAP